MSSAACPPIPLPCPQTLSPVHFCMNGRIAAHTMLVICMGYQTCWLKIFSWTSFAQKSYFVTHKSYFVTQKSYFVTQKNYFIIRCFVIPLQKVTAVTVTPLLRYSVTPLLRLRYFYQMKSHKRCTRVLAGHCQCKVGR